MNADPNLKWFFATTKRWSEIDIFDSIQVGSRVKLIGVDDETDLMSKIIFYQNLFL